MKNVRCRQPFRLGRGALWIVLLAALLLAAGCGCGFEDDDDDDDAPGLPIYDSPDDDADDDADDDVDDDTADDDTDECDWATHDPFIVQGKEELSAGRPNPAYDAFADALKVCPDSADAMMGMLISDALWFTKWVKTWIDYLSSDWWLPADKDQKSALSVLQKVIRYSMLPVDEEMIDLAGRLKAHHPEVRFFLESLPMVAEGDHVVLQMGGEWDIADVGNLEAYARFWDFIGRLLLAFDLSFYWPDLAQAPSPPPEATILELIHHYSGLILDILANEDYPDFLTLLPGGDEDLSTAAINMGLACRGLPASLPAIQAETDPQEDDVMGYVDENGNGVWDEGENYTLPYFGELNDGQNDFILNFMNVSDKLGRAFLNGGPEDPQPLLPNWFWLPDLDFLLDFAELLDPDLSFPPIAVPIGFWFYHPSEDGIRNVVQIVAQFLFDNTMPP